MGGRGSLSSSRMHWAGASWEISQVLNCPAPGLSLTLRGRLQVIGPWCSEEEELLHGSLFNLNVELSNSGLCEDVVRLAEDPAGVGVGGDQQL